MSAQIDPWNIYLPVILWFSAEIAELLLKDESKLVGEAGQAFETAAPMLNKNPY